MILSIRFALTLVCALLTLPLFLEIVSAQDRDLPAGCDTLLDPAAVIRDAPPPELNVTDNVCLDSHRVETWFLSHGGWSSDLTEDHRYWRLRPPAFPTRTTLFLVMPDGEQREVVLISQPSSS